MTRECWVRGHPLLGAALLVLVGVGGLSWSCYESDIRRANARVRHGSKLIVTRCGPIEYADAGLGFPMLSVHGSGGGFDQGMAFAGRLTNNGIRVIAMSRFGYLRTPIRPDTSASAQADAYVCLLDALGIDSAAVLGGSAGAPSALQLAIRHPDRVSALILLAPLTYKPPGVAGTAKPMPAWIENLMMTALGSDFLFWTASHVARDTMIRTVLATPPELLAAASLSERARIYAMLTNILPVSKRAAGLQSDTAASKNLSPAKLDTVSAPTLIMSARDDGYGTYASAQYTAGRIPGAHFIGFDQGGHTWVGHDDEVMAAIKAIVLRTGTQPSRGKCAFGNKAC